MTDYKTVSKSGVDEFVEKRSRFIGYCEPVTTQAQALEFIEKIKSKHWDAKHNVYAYILREGGIKRYSDDGEPQGTAGVPVLEVMQKMGITDAVVVVTRYFGGILLGAGGLVRAYSHGAKIAVESACPAIMQLCDNCTLKCSYNQYGRVSSVVLSGGGVVLDSAFTDQVEMKFRVKKGCLDKINKELAAASSGEVEAASIDESYYLQEI
ncbi:MULTISPECIES: YigZ family protein [unclassified Ruminococcus]|uniref:IMPACT family protein n=1 Tax=unclassified Ruminococcus TaxID=2608920 RepID=UPI00210A3E41|nr:MULTISPECIES: YigZ family protein [unclassified Ruminococcus]MCQ4022213.1 DUF1949 domain-containing protein [Ruminococcus sp. zg-924]MCQ4115224.1 DUF1949 domain-containing protein [Ruminococcus sp. zg-921]